MAILRITFEPPEEGAASAIMHADEEAWVTKPTGRVKAKDLEVGDEVRTVPEAPFTARVQLIENVGA